MGRSTNQRRGTTIKQRFSQGRGTTNGLNLNRSLTHSSGRPAWQPSIQIPRRSLQPLGKKDYDDTRDFKLPFQLPTNGNHTATKTPTKKKPYVISNVRL
jgi:hypothetical protein